MRFLLKDTRGKESYTLTLVVAACGLLLAKYAVSGMALGPLGVQSAISAMEFGGGFMLILAPLLQREWTEKTKVTP